MGPNPRSRPGTFKNLQCTIDLKRLELLGVSLPDAGFQTCDALIVGRQDYLHGTLVLGGDPGRQFLDGFAKNVDNRLKVLGRNVACADRGEERKREIRQHQGDDDDSGSDEYEFVTHREGLA